MSQLNTSSYPIEKPTGQCAITGQALEPGQEYVATLVEVEEADLAKGQSMPPGGLKRLDVAMAAWNDGARPARLFSHWKSVVPEPNQKKKLLVDDAVLVNLFLRLEDTDDADRLAFRFVLGLILMRKRLLRYESTVQKSAAKAPAGTGDSKGPSQAHDADAPGPVSDASQGSASGDADASSQGSDTKPASTSDSTDQGHDAGGAITQRWWQVSVKAPGSGQWQEAQMLDPDLDEHGIANVTEHLGEILEAEL